MSFRLPAGCLLLLCAAALLRAQSHEEATDPKKDSFTELKFCEQLRAARLQYQQTMEQMRAYYIKIGDARKAKWVEEELILYHRIPKRAFRLELDVPPATLRGTDNIPAANKLYMRAMSFKGRGWGNDYVDNQRRAEILLQELLSRYPQSDRISDTAYQLGDIYEGKPYQHYERSGLYFQRCYQWNPTTHFDARIRAARVYDRYLLDRQKAVEIYKEVASHETDASQVQEATRRLKDLSIQR